MPDSLRPLDQAERAITCPTRTEKEQLLPTFHVTDEFDDESVVHEHLRRSELDTIIETPILNMATDKDPNVTVLSDGDSNMAEELEKSENYFGVNATSTPVKDDGNQVPPETEAYDQTMEEPKGEKEKGRLGIKRQRSNNASICVSFRKNRKMLKRNKSKKDKNSIPLSLIHI